MPNQPKALNMNTTRYRNVNDTKGLKNVLSAFIPVTNNIETIRILIILILMNKNLGIFFHYDRNIITILYCSNYIMRIEFSFKKGN